MKNSFSSVATWFCFLSLLFCFACAEHKVSDTYEPPNLYTYGLYQQWVLTGFRQPESVLVSPHGKYIYVSNVNGEEEGFISRLRKDGKELTLQWLTGIASPTGMAYYNQKLYVVNQTEVLKIDPKTATILERYPSSAKTLNDITVTDQGQFFITDLAGAAIYTLENNKVVSWLKSEKFPTPNGITVNGEELLVGFVGDILSPKLEASQLGSLYSINLEDKSIELVEPTERMASIDGLQLFSHGILVSDPLARKLIYIRNGQKQLIDGMASIADFGLDERSKMLYAPTLFQNSLIAYELRREKWHRLLTKSDYVNYAADRFYGEPEGMSIATSDGELYGEFSNKILSGTWMWLDNYFYRKSTLGEMDLGADSIVIEVTPTKMRLTLKKGKGIQVVYNEVSEQQIQDENKITVASTFNIKQKRKSAFVKAMLENVDLVRQESGNAEMRFYQKRDDGTKMIVLGRNKDEVQFETHLRLVEERGIAKRLAPASVTNPVTYMLKPVYSYNGSVLRKPANEESYTVFSIFKVRPEYRRELVRQMKNQVEKSRKEKGTLVFDFYESINVPNTFITHGEWRTETDANRHFENTKQSKFSNFFKIATEGDVAETLWVVKELDKVKQ